MCSVHGIYTAHSSGHRAFPLFHLVWYRADRVITISEAGKAWLVHDCGHPADRAQVIHYGIEPERFMRHLPRICARPGVWARDPSSRLWGVWIL
ncbi:MAG TPA: hypothetical protein DCL13_04985 [Peptococcaceae bacterium]|nr:hypothetical protein [Peptococcaceae bacterium]